MVPPKFNRGRATTRFKPNNKHHETVTKNRNNEDGDEEEDSCDIRNYNRLPSEVYDLGLAGTELTPSILRPVRDRINQLEEQQKVDKYITNNRIVNMSMFGKVMTEACARHKKNHQYCETVLGGPDWQFPAATELCQGLGCSVEVACTKCTFVQERKPLSPQTIRKKKGRRPFVVNSGLGQYMASSSTALNSITTLFPLIDVRCPNEKTILSHIYSACDVNKQLSHDQFNMNIQAISMITDHMAENAPQKVIVSGDTVYNNASRGANRQPGTQSSTPFLEMTTKKNLILGIEVHTQICHKCGLGIRAGAFHKGCIRNYPSPGPLSQVEKRASQDFYNKIDHSLLSGKITHHLSDACKQIKTSKTHKIERILCKQHVQRGQRRLFYKISADLSKELFGKGKAVNLNKNAMSHVIVNRCSKELTKARKKFKDDQKFFQFTQKARFNIVKCLSGFHAGCNKDSLVCQPKQRRTSKHEFPFMIKDMAKIQEVIDYRYVFL